MPSLFRATIGLMQRQWEWHKANPGKLSQMAQEAVDRRMAVEALPESAVDQASIEVVQAFWDRYDLEGQYAICNDRLIRHKATDEQIAQDARMMRVPVERLLPLLDELYGLELEFQLLKIVSFGNGSLPTSILPEK